MVLDVSMKASHFVGTSAALLLAAVLIWPPGCGDDDDDDDDKGAECCACLVEQGCWGSDLCPRSTDCLCIFSSTYDGDCPPDPCLAYDPECQAANCPVCDDVLN
jgi:hypothetical protein